MSTIFKLCTLHRPKFSIDSTSLEACTAAVEHIEHVQLTCTWRSISGTYIIYMYVSNILQLIHSTGHTCCWQSPQKNEPPVGNVCSTSWPNEWWLELVGLPNRKPTDHDDLWGEGWWNTDHAMYPANSPPRTTYVPSWSPTAGRWPSQRALLLSPGLVLVNKGAPASTFLTYHRYSWSRLTRK